MAGKSLGTLTIGIVADIGAYAKGIDQAMTKTTEFQKSLDKSLGVVDNSYSKTMSSMAKFYQKQESDQNKAIQALALNTNSLEGLMLRREAAQEHLDSLFLESERTSIKYIAAQKGIENSYIQGVMRLKALGLGMEQAGNKTRLARHEMLNFGYQINDVVVSLASGQRPLTVFAQQGAQIGQIAASSGVGVKGLALALGDMAKAAGRATAALALNPYFLAFAAVVGSATLAVNSLKDELSDNAALEDMRYQIALAGGDVDKFNAQLKELGGEAVTLKDIFSVLFDELDFSTATAKFSEFEDWLNQRFYNIARAAVASREAMKAFLATESIEDAIDRGNESMGEFDAWWEDLKKKFQQPLQTRINTAALKAAGNDFDSLERKYQSVMDGIAQSTKDFARKHQQNIDDINKRWSNLGIGDQSGRLADIAKENERYQKQISDYNKQQQKAAEKTAKEKQKRPDYIKSINQELDNEIARAGMLNEAKEREARLDKMSETLAKKKFAQLSDKEKKIIEDKVAVLEEEEKKQKVVDALYSGSSKRAVEEYTIQQAALLTALRKGYITQEEYNKSLYATEEAHKAATDATYSFQKSLEETQRTYGVFGDELTIMKALTPEVMAGLTDGQIEAAKQSIYLEEALKRVNNELQNIWNDTSGTDETIAARIKALNDALAGTGEGKAKVKISQGYYDVGMQDVKSSQNQSEFTKAGASSIYSETTGQYDELIKKELEWKNAREAGLVTVTQYENAMRDLYSQQLQLDALNGQMESPFDAFSSGLDLYASSFKGTFSELQTIGQNFSQSLGDGIADAFARSVVQGESFEELIYSLSQTILTELISSIVRMGIQWALSAALGNAAMSTATIASLGTVTTAATASLATLTAATTAAGLTSTAAWTPAAIAASLATGGGNAAPATAGINATALAGAAAIKGTALAGFESGGYTGNGGIKDIAGVVHGKEFVLNASATAKNRPYLEAMNNGASFQDMAQPVSGGGVTIQQNLTVSGAGDKQLETMLANVARQSALEGAKQGYGLVAKDFNSNGTLRKTLRRK